MELLFYLIKNFAWILIGFLLIRGPIRELAAASPEAGAGQIRRAARFWRGLRLVAGVYCITVSFWNLGTTLLVHLRAH